MRLPTSAAWSLLAGLSSVQAQYLVSELSFGYSSRMGPDSSSVPNFGIQGNPTQPEILSNKIILTPPAPGNQRGAIWADRPLMHNQWLADVEFRVNGPERGGGNMNIWLARDGQHTVGTSSVYTASHFEGLVLVIDMHMGSAGKIRGFLNDGTKDFKAQQVDGLSFGHCDYSYRNLGRFTQIKLRQTETSFKVEVDGKSCFESDSITIPTGYKFGITAASADNPDSFEVSKLVVMTDSLNADQIHLKNEPNIEADKPSTKFTRGGMFQDQQSMNTDNFEKELPDEDAGKITSSKAQFADLHNRLQSVNHHLSTIFRTVAQLGTIGEKRHEEISVQVGELKGLMTKLDKVIAMEEKLESLEKQMKDMHQDLRYSVTTHGQSVLYQVKDSLTGHHDTLAETLKPAGHGRLIFIIVCGQLLSVVGYVVYKRRKNSSPKKYL